MLQKPVKVRRTEDAGELRLPADCLNALGLAEGTSGTVRVSPERLVLTPEMEIGRAREEIAALAAELEGAQEALRRLARALPREPGEVEDVRAALECLLQDELLPAVRKLWTLSNPASREDVEADG